MPRYRVAFFNKLAEKYNIVLIHTNNTDSISSLQTVDRIVDDLNFPVYSSPELSNGCSFCKPGYYHKDIFRLIHKHSPDVIIASHGYITSILANSRLRKEYMSIVRSTIAWACNGYRVTNPIKYRNQKEFSQSIFRAFRGHFQWKSKYNAMREIDGFLAYSGRTAKFWNIAYDIDIENITVAHNAIDTSRLAALHSDFTIKKKRKKLKDTFIFVGRVIEQKSLDKLIYALKDLIPEYPQVHLKIIGEGPALNDMKYLCEELGVSDAVTFTGGIYNEVALAQELCNSGLFVLPGLGGLGMNTAMACGLPVVCGYADGTEEHLIEEDETGYRFDGTKTGLVKCLRYALDNRECWRDMGLKAKGFVTNKYNLDNMVKAFSYRIDQL